MAGAQAFRIGVPAFNITLSTLEVLSEGVAPGTYWAGFALGSNGRFQTMAGTGTYPAGEVVTYFLPQWAGLNGLYSLMGANYEVRLTDVGGIFAPTPAISDAVGTWLSLNPGRQWVRQNTFNALGGNQLATWRVEIRKRASGTIILGTADYRVRLRANPP